MSEKHTVLVVDDDLDVREVLTVILSKRFNLLVAAQGSDAIGIIAERQIDLLLTDIVMPGMNGFELADQAVSIRPGLRVLYMTGYAGHGQSTRPRHGKLIPKPFRPVQMVSEINSALAD
jgi:DNA-binding NtrC family response regulator